MQDEPCKQRRRKTAARAHSREDKSIDESAFLFRYPAGNELVPGWIDHRLAGSEGKANGDQQQHRVRNTSRDQGGKSGGDAPPHHAERDNATRAKTRGQPSSRHLEAGIANQKSAEDPAQALISQPILRADLKASDGDICPVEVRNSAKNKEPRCEPKS